ncbi:hypothetical protein F8388_000361 [Cannabis sativa]|uniref:Uncharacterized protein n=1 Tax=Cannabis sativa TaxID=3483 RepID=A0A7J6FNB9_CANSA|nr:hypothetical protein F8388_000361 [Cannabis sativa]
MRIGVYYVILSFSAKPKSTVGEEEEQNYGRKLVGVKVGVVVDYESLVGKMGLRCINMSLSHFYSSHPNYTTRLHIHATDSKKHVIGAAAAGT